MNHMGRRTRECYLCGQDYQYCPTCSQDKMKPAWMSDFHSENCKNIFDICTRFNMSLMSKDEAQDALNACDLSNKANFKSYVQRDLENIFKVDEVPVPVAEPKFKRGKRIEIKPVDDAMIIEESHEVVVKKENE